MPPIALMTTSCRWPRVREVDNRRAVGDAHEVDAEAAKEPALPSAELDLFFFDDGLAVLFTFVLEARVWPREEEVMLADRRIGAQPLLAREGGPQALTQRRAFAGPVDAQLHALASAPFLERPELMLLVHEEDAWRGRSRHHCLDLDPPSMADSAWRRAASTNVQSLAALATQCVELVEREHTRAALGEAEDIVQARRRLTEQRADHRIDAHDVHGQAERPAQRTRGEALADSGWAGDQEARASRQPQLGQACAMARLEE